MRTLLTVLMACMPLVPQVRIPGPGGAAAAAGAACTFVQTRNGGYGGNISITATTGNLLIVGMVNADTIYNTPYAFTTPSDGSNTYTLSGVQGNADSTANISISVIQYYAANITGGSLTINIHGVQNAFATELSGCSKTSPYVGHAESVNPGSTNMVTGTFSAGATAGEAIVALFGTNTSGLSFTAGSGLTIPTNGTFDNASQGVTEYGIVVSSQTTAALTQGSGGSQYNYSTLIASVFH